MLQLDDVMSNEMEIMIPVEKEEPKKVASSKKIEKDLNEKVLINCLRKERIIVRFIPKEGKFNDPKHLLYGNMSGSVTKTYVVPRLSSGSYVNVLTDEEKDFLEDALGLEPNALSIYKKENNFWDDSNETGISSVVLTKDDTYFDLSVPDDYIKYKILLANKDYICPSLDVLERRPKSSYSFVVVESNGETKFMKSKLDYKMLAYKEFGKVEDDFHLLRAISELYDNRAENPGATLEYLQGKVGAFIEEDTKKFLKVIKDPLLKTKAIMKQAMLDGLIIAKGDFYYVKHRNKTVPLCDAGENPTLDVAARFLNLPKNQEIKFTLDTHLNCDK